MKKFKKLIASLTVAAALSTSAGVLDAGTGHAYEGCCTASSISPLVALGTVAVVAAIVVVVKNNNDHHHSGGGSGSGESGGNSHSHSHSHG